MTRLPTPRAQDSKAGDNKPADSAARPAKSESLARQQAQVADKYRELEKVLTRMAELTAHNDPRRAALLRQAIQQGKERDIDHQFEQLVEVLQQERLSVGIKGQTEVRDDLSRLLDLLLSEDRGKRILSEKRRIREYLRRVNQIIKDQQITQAETIEGQEEKKLAQAEGEISDKTGQLTKDIDKNEGKNGDGKPPGKSGDPKDSQGGDKKNKEGGADKQDGDKEDSVAKRIAPTSKMVPRVRPTSPTPRTASHPASRANQRARNRRMPKRRPKLAMRPTRTTRTPTTNRANRKSLATRSLGRRSRIRNQPATRNRATRSPAKKMLTRTATRSRTIKTRPTATPSQTTTTKPIAATSHHLAIPKANPSQARVANRRKASRSQGNRAKLATTMTASLPRRPRPTTIPCKSG